MSEEDSWLQVLLGWTGQALGDGAWSVYAGVWPEHYERPAVLWRLTGVEAGSGNAACDERIRRYAAHVLGRDPQEQSQAVLRLAEAVQTAAKLPFNVAERRYLLVKRAEADLSADAFATGQLIVTLGRRTIRQAAPAPLMRTVSFQQNEG